MANSASQASEVVLPAQPGPMMSYDEYWQKNNSYGTISPDNQFWIKFLNFFTGEDKKQRGNYDAYVQNYQQAYENYVADVNRYYEDKAVQSARAWDEKMSSSQYSRTFEDLQKAGLNPYMLLSSGSVSPAGYGSPAKASYDPRKAVSRHSLQNATSDNKGRDFALVLLAVARLIAAL